MIQIVVVRTHFEVRCLALSSLALSSFLCDWYFFSRLAEENGASNCLF